VDPVLSIISLLSVPNVFLRPKGCYDAADEARAKFSHQDGDHLTILNAFKAYNLHGGDEQFCRKNFLNHRSLRAATRIKEQLRNIFIKKELSI